MDLSIGAMDNDPLSPRGQILYIQAHKKLHQQLLPIATSRLWCPAEFQPYLNTRYQCMGEGRWIKVFLPIPFCYGIAVKVPFIQHILACTIQHLFLGYVRASNQH